MANSAKNIKAQFSNNKTYAYPSWLGSHKSMVDQPATEALNQTGKVVIKDEYGYYTTDANRLDNKCADPNRYASSRLESLFRNATTEK